MPSQVDETTPDKYVMPENYDLAASMVNKTRAELNTSLGILLTMAEAASPDRDISAYKRLIKREIYRVQDWLQSVIYTDLEVQDPKFAVAGAQPEEQFDDAQA